MPEEITAYAKGVMGEDAACAALEGLGMQCVDRRYRSPAGEVDLVMLDGETLVFVEVKARERMPSVQAQSAVTPAKQKRIIQTARWYLCQHPEQQDRLVRFDVVLVAADETRHILNAFEGALW